MSITTNETNATRTALEEQLDKALISETLQSYALGCDTRDIEGLRQVFSEDAAAQYSADPWLRGRGTIVDWLDGATEGLLYSQHNITPVRVAVDGDRAEVVAYLTSYQRTDAAPDQLIKMSSRYDFRLVRDAGVWRISELVLHVGWFETRSFAQPEGGIRTIEEGTA